MYTMLMKCYCFAESIDGGRVKILRFAAVKGNKV